MKSKFMSRQGRNCSVGNDGIPSKMPPGVPSPGAGFFFSASAPKPWERAALLGVCRLKWLGSPYRREGKAETSVRTEQSAERTNPKRMMTDRPAVGLTIVGVGALATTEYTSEKNGLPLGSLYNSQLPTTLPLYQLACPCISVERPKPQLIVRNSRSSLVNSSVSRGSNRPERLSRPLK
jgi:hypothetical protein